MRNGHEADYREIGRDFFANFEPVSIEKADVRHV